jgi:hypothetical protein
MKPCPGYNNTKERAKVIAGGTDIVPKLKQRQTALPWITKIKIVQERLRLPGIVFDQGEPVWLPFALACAYDLCKHYGTRPFKELELIWKDYWEYLRFYEEDTEEMYRQGWEAAEVVGRRKTPLDSGGPNRDNRIGDTVIFVLPSTSGVAQKYWNESHWIQLADFVKKRL